LLKLASCVVLNHELYFTGHGDLSTLGATNQSCVKLVELNVEVSGHGRKNLSVSTSCSYLQWLKNLGARLDVNELTRLDAERRAVNELAINEDVTVHNKLTSLSGRASETCAQDESVETHLEKLNEVLTGQTRLLACFLEDVTKLSLADTVLSAKTLLLTQTNGVVRVSLALGASVLTGSVGALLEVLSCLRREGDAQSTREAGLATGT
jgi:hypothetical protein